MKPLSWLTCCLMLLSAVPLPAADKPDKPGKPAKVKFSTRRGVRETPFDLTISTEARDATLYFTTDGSPPAPGNGRLFKEPIRIGHTTAVRAAGYRGEIRVTEIDTHTFIFIADVLNQTGAGAPPTWGTSDGKAVIADYEMDPEIVTNAAYGRELPEALRSLPSLSLVLTAGDLYDPLRGLYPNPKENGEDWERATSAELIQNDGTKGFQVDCGLRIQGGWNRRPEESPKHSFRLAFRKKYGAGKLKFPLFADQGPVEFDNLILRAGCNNSWLHWSGTERHQGDYVRDQWMRESYAAMGHPSARGMFVHLYLNGLYWGVYNLTERPDEDFAAQHLGGKAKDIDARNSDKILSGDDVVWKELFTLANGGLHEPKRYDAARKLLDVPAFVDFMILNLYGANGDWDRASNWYAARRRNGDGGYQFFVWDGERTLESIDANVLRFDDDFSPPRLFHKLCENDDFRRLFAERVQRHLSGDGVLTPGPASERFRKWADRLNGAMVAESARWGDYRRDVHPYKVGPYELYTRDDHWRPEIQRLVTEYFPKRPAVFLRQLGESGLFPTGK